jgi:hypothetical protein
MLVDIIRPLLAAEAHDFWHSPKSNKKPYSPPYASLTTQGQCPAKPASNTSCLYFALYYFRLAHSYAKFKRPSLPHKAILCCPHFARSWEATNTGSITVIFCSYHRCTATSSYSKKRWHVSAPGRAYGLCGGRDCDDLAFCFFVARTKK